VYTGVTNAPTGKIGTTMAYYVGADGYVSKLIITKGNTFNDAKASVFFYGYNANNDWTWVDGVQIFSIPAVVDGSITTVKVSAPVYAQLNNGLYTDCLYTNGVITTLGTAATAANSSTGYDKVGMSLYSFSTSATSASTTTVTKVGAYSDSTKMYYVNTVTGAITDLTADQANVMGVRTGDVAYYTWSATAPNMTTCIVFYSAGAYTAAK
jgi:hypothetical protein